jgi:hypothetical protein
VDKVREPCFGAHAARLAALGLVVVPLGGPQGKKPLVRGFNTWMSPMDEQMLVRLAHRHADANIGVVTGPSRLIVVDCDTMDVREKAVELFGPTPLRVRSARGVHLYYRAPALQVKSMNLRPHGLEIDVKSGSGLVVVPPSLHRSGVRYAFEESAGWAALPHLPLFPAKALARFKKSREPAAPTHDTIPEGERTVTINRHLCARVGEFSSEADVVRAAAALNARCSPPLPETEYLRIAAKVWRDIQSGKLRPWTGRASVVRIAARDLDLLLSQRSTGPDALMLLALLRWMHTARVSRGDTFAITPRSMSGSVLPWSRKRIEKARDLLLEFGLVVMVRPFKGRGKGARYTLPLERESEALPSDG